MARLKQPKHLRPLNPVKWATRFEATGVTNLSQAIVTLGTTLLGVLVALRLRSAPSWAIVIAAIVIAMAILMISTTMRRLPGSDPEVSSQPTSKPKSKKNGAQKKTKKTQRETMVRITRGDLLADAEGISGVSTVPEIVKSSTVEGEPDMSVISTLPVAVEYRSRLSQLSSDLSALGEVPALPQYIAGGVILRWQLRSLDWVNEAKRILTEATALAKDYESRHSTSVRLAHAIGDAEADLTWIRDLVSRKADSSDKDELSRRCAEIIAAISEIIEYAAGL